MVILEIDVDGVLAVEGECKPQIAGHGDRPTPFLCAAQYMKPPAGNVHIVGPGGGVEPIQHPLDASPVFGRDAPRRTGSEKSIETFVTKAADHGAAMGRIVKYCVTPCQELLYSRRTRMGGSRRDFVCI